MTASLPRPRMTPSLPNPSSRLVRAAAAEQAELARHRDRLVRRRDVLAAELRELDDALAATDRRIDVLARLGDPAGFPTAPGRSPDPESASTAATHAPEATRDRDNRRVLRGPAIREVAVRVLVTQPERIDALHYRRWHELLENAGYRVAGKDSLAVFLTQLSRSPVVRRATEPGVYEVDRQAPVHIRERLDRLHAELREVTLAACGPVDLATVRARRHELDLAISQQERAFEEAVRVLGGDDPRPGNAEAAGAR
jgi:hypothetical protein